MRRMMVAAGLLASLSGIGVAWGQTSVIDERRAGLKRMGEHMEAIRDTARAGGDTRPLVARTQDMTAWFTTFGGRFPDGSGSPTGTGPGQTRALPAVFSDRAGFERAREGVLPAIANLQQAAASGDAAATGRALQATGEACGTCHRAYRAR